MDVMVADHSARLAPLDALRQRYAAAPGDRQALRDLVRALAAAGLNPQALELLERSARATDDTAGARDLLREWLLGERQIEAVQRLLRGLAEAPTASNLVDRAVLAQLHGDFAGAATLCRQALQIDAGHAPAYNHLGRSLFIQGHAEPALQALARATELDPAYVEAWNNFGHVLRAAQQPDKALPMFERAVALAPACRTPRLNLGITLIAADAPQRALEVLAPLQDPDRIDPEAYRNAGLALHTLGRLEEAQQHYRLALQAAPQDATTLYYQAVVLAELGAVASAREALQRALALQPGDADAWAELAALEETQNRLDEAEQALRHGLACAPQHAQLSLMEAKLLRRRRRLDEALQRLAGIRPEQLPERVAQHYHFECATTLDRLDRTAEAYAAFDRGNALAARSPRRAGLRPEAVFERIRAYREWAEQGLALPKDAAQGDTGHDLCFLIGFPRSGTTLLDTLLDAHPGIHSVEEKPTIEIVRALAEQQLGDFPHGLAGLGLAELQRLRRRYREILTALAVPAGAGLVLDKLPLRTIEAGFVHALFPQARFLFSLRHPCDVVLSNFMQEYAPNEAFIHFDSLASSARLYDQVMRLWQVLGQRLETRTHYVRYEALVRDPATCLRELSGFLGIAYLPELIDGRLDHLRGSVRTNSYHQVAEPLYTRAVDRWMRYRDQLAPQLPILAPHIQHFGYPEASA